ncbi:MAG: methyltransferase domain-containing protein [Chitinispirillaceae bacterium]|nr:methyltransferase domain-containing protein [Chitinispirillaceae bacterium]
MSTLPHSYERDRSLWNECADTYERRIVHGHPDVTAYETFEQRFIDRVAIHLTRDRGHMLHCYDFGCGSGRIHALLAPMLITAPEAASSAGIAHIGGIDFSERMIELARRNIIDSGLGALLPKFLSFDIGSAFDVPPYRGNHTPLAVCVCNSIGVMQGPEGARKLFSVMNRYIRPRNGIAVISCYCAEAVAGYALSNYESTMDVCGQPCWLKPDTYASPEYTLVPRRYKRAFDPDPAIVVDVVDARGKCIKKEVTLTRDPEAVRAVIATGKIDAYDNYHSRWYPIDRIKTWMREFWGEGTLWHIQGAMLDRLHGEPAQIAVVDYSGSFESLGRSWGFEPFHHVKRHAK